jgi:sec-independent protein translocase protein TatA
MGELSPWHWIIVLLIFALLFGSKRLPDAARGLGRSMRIFKAEMQSARDDSPTGDAGQAPVAPVEDAVPQVDAVPQAGMAATMNMTPEPVKPAVEH